MVTLVAQFTMKAGAEQRALRLVDAVREQADREQPGTLLYLVHRVLENKKETRTLLFYECYRDQKALAAHLASSSWQRLTKAWPRCFEGTPATIDPIFLHRTGGFVHLDAP